MSFRLALVLLLFAALSIGIAGSAKAAPVGPLPNYDADTGAAYFVPSPGAQFTISVEVFDLDSIQATSSFGFYFWNDPGTLITIFDAADQATDPNDSSTYPSAFVSFKDGIVFDFDEGVNQDTFTPTLNPDPFGFFLTVMGTTVYSDPFLNAGNADLFTALQSQINPLAMALIFEFPTGVVGGGLDNVVNFNLAINIQPVPLPGALLLMGSVLPLLAFFRRRRTV